MNAYLVPILIILICAVSSHELFKQEILSKSVNNTIVEGFTRKFFQKVMPTYFIGLDYTQLLGNAFFLMKTLDKMIPFNINTTLVKDSIERFELLNNNKIQFILARAHVLHHVLYKTMPGLANISLDNIRFVASLYRLPINVLANSMAITEFGKLKNSKLFVNVGAKYSGDYFAALDLFLAYNIVVDEDVYLTYYELDELVEHYKTDVNVVVYAASHPDPLVVKLTEAKLTRFVEIRRFNDGNIYHISLDEAPFYRDHPYYLKTILMKQTFGDGWQGTLSNYYPNLVLYGQQFDPYIEQPLVVYDSLFVNTIGVRYYLFSNTKTDVLSVSQLLYNMKLNMDEINKFEFIDDKIDSTSMADYTLPLPVHDGAREFYFRSGLFTNLSSKECLMIDGKCTQRQLYEHHLYLYFGKTFDQLFNSEITRNPFILKNTPPIKTNRTFDDIYYSR
jgi:TRAP-type uncharacterized transport system substrate-binding protein